MKEIQKKRPSIPCFWKDTCMEIEAVEKIFQKKSKKSEPFGTFLERYLFGDDQDFCWIVKKLKKSSKFFGHFGFFLEDTYTRAEKGINNISHAGKEKNGKNGKKSDHFRIFVEDTCLERSDGNFNNNAQ